MRHITTLALAITAGFSAPVFAQTPATTQPPTQSASQSTQASTTPQAIELKVGDAAPAFSLPGSDGKTHKLSDYKGKAVVLAWFPRAFTGG